ncbi:hypothetical protein AQUCO_03400036v1 [Aquilegia coerulea]|uniref:Glyoxalase At5g48480-like N-terminal domain-containing protein n=1 Tax=Aquilegia coerulea TaxID=218851 RepID=A0A2G5CY74_AQUCA|nr:hypothetical protein AQUCO_03400036v1 [Aquilegia coerulea]
MAQESVVEVVSDVNNGGSENGKTKSVSFSALKHQLIFQAPKAAEAIQFYKSAFGAEELNRDIHPKRKADQELPLILSAELKLASSVIIISDQTDDSAAPSRVKWLKERMHAVVLVLRKSRTRTVMFGQSALGRK